MIGLYNLISMTKIISAYEARTNLGEILNLVYYRGDTVIIEKMGKPMVKLTKVDISTKKTIRDKKRWVGIWDNKDGGLIEKYALDLRNSGKILSP